MPTYSQEELNEIVRGIRENYLAKIEYLEKHIRRFVIAIVISNILLLLSIFN